MRRINPADIPIIEGRDVRYGEAKHGVSADCPCEPMKAEDPLFPIVDARKTLAWINERAGTIVQGHGLRATFASIAEELVSSALLKRMLNHATAGDVTLGHYVAKSEAQLRAGWQAVADFVEETAKLP